MLSETATNKSPLLPDINVHGPVVPDPLPACSIAEKSQDAVVVFVVPTREGSMIKERTFNSSSNHLFREGGKDWWLLRNPH